MSTLTPEAQRNQEMFIPAVKIEIKKEVDCMVEEETSCHDYKDSYKSLEPTNQAEYVNYYDSKSSVLEQLKKEKPDDEYLQPDYNISSKLVFEDTDLLTLVNRQKDHIVKQEEELAINSREENQVAIKIKKLEEQDILDNAGNTNIHYDVLVTPQEVDCKLFGRKFKNITQQSSQCSQNIINKTGPHEDQLNIRHTINVIVDYNKKERQRRYREQNREKLKQREEERRKRRQLSQSIAGPSTSSNKNILEVNNEEKSIAGPSTSSNTNKLEVNNEEKSIAGPSTSSNTNKLEANNEEIITALQKKREYHRRYRERNRDKLRQRKAERMNVYNILKVLPSTSSDTNILGVNIEKIITAVQKQRECQRRYRERNRDKLRQREAERRRRLQNAEMITELSTSPIRIYIKKGKLSKKKTNHQCSCCC